MALMAGSGPFGPRPAGSFNFEFEAPAHQLYLEPTSRRLRVVVDGEVIADTTSARVLHETGLLPVYYVPLKDVRPGALEPSQLRTHCPFKGDAAYFDVRVDGEVHADAVWTYPEPIAGCPALAGLVSFDPRAVEIYEETERVVGHPRDPYHRVDAIASDRGVTVRFGGEVVASSERPVLVFETGLPMRTYLPAEDVRSEVLRPSDTATVCPYKGRTGRYHTIAVGDERAVDAVWVYEEPQPAVADIAGLLAFDDDQVEVEHHLDAFAPIATTDGGG
ncbi:MAG: DUF427 domain-containing protein [Nitriliruptoraceae bacterium]